MEPPEYRELTIIHAEELGKPLITHRVYQSDNVQTLYVILGRQFSTIDFRVCAGI